MSSRPVMARMPGAAAPGARNGKLSNTCKLYTDHRRKYRRDKRLGLAYGCLPAGSREQQRIRGDGAWVATRKCKRWAQTDKEGTRQPMAEISPPTAGASAQQDLTALVVEDEGSIAMLLRFILERDGFRVEHASDGRQAQQLIATLAPPAVTLLDIMLPYVDGFELITNIRAQPGWEKVPVMMLTAKGSERDIARALDAGADDYMVKPFQPDELKARIRRLLRSRS